MATGDYVVFIDDDDWVADDYVQSILEAIAHRPDCIGFRIDCSMNGQPKTAVGSLRYKAWEDNKDGYDYVRSIYHKNPVKRELALRTGYKDMRYAEDHDYSMRLQQWLGTEYFIDKVLYYYRYSNAIPHNTKYGIHGEQYKGVRY
jgi:glycosyltransferase involved in cell wall biosynthesis